MLNSGLLNGGCMGFDDKAMTIERGSKTGEVPRRGLLAELENLEVETGYSFPFG